MAENIQITAYTNVDGDNRWRVQTNVELVMPDLLPSMDFPSAQLDELVESGALFEVGDIIVGCLGVFRQVTTHFDPDDPRAIEFTIEGIDPEEVRVIFTNIIFGELTVGIAISTDCMVTGEVVV